MDKITIEDLTVLYKIGVPEAERSKPQRLLISAILEGDFSAAAASDDIAATINYYDVCQRILNFGEDRSWKLIETLASEIGKMILSEFKPAAVEVEVKKFIIAEARYISFWTRLSR